MTSIQKIKKIFARRAWSLLRFSGMGPLLLRIHPKSALRKWGWFTSFRKKRSIDKSANPTPWWTYSAISFLKERLLPETKVLEFGSGGSTLWLCQFAAKVLSAEDDPEWAEYVKSNMPANGEIVICDSYEAFITDHYFAEQYDLIIIDAGHRLNIGRKIFSLLSDRGVVLWDNTDGPDWIEIKSLFFSHGFSEISFSGMTAQEVALSRTTIFYRKGSNCLDI